jgi:hypothetical protein
MLCQCGTIMSKTAKHCRPCDIIRRKNNRGTLGMSKTSIYNRWHLMLRRCYDINDSRYFQYGGRGIKVCPHWHKFENYFADIGNVPFKNAEVDRIDPDGDYEPKNCRWVNKKENMKNTRWSKTNRDKYIMIRKDKLCQDCRTMISLNKEIEVK